ncbi:zinc-ribbon domain-containing protein [bacterium]|nr:zinc-ribbon domain-containing protein [bacterium]
MDIYCEDCGEKLSEKDRICPICGSKKRKAPTLTLNLTKPLIYQQIKK